jgi:flagellar hook protein FlgE
MLFGSFYSGLSGLQANSTALSVIGNNLANINTAGFKRSSAQFAQVISNTVDGISGAGNPIQIGLGVNNTEVTARFDQGSIQTTGIGTHLAIQGRGFFQVNQNGNNMYTRAGNFQFDEEGYLVAANGARAQGFVGTDPATGTVITTNGIEDIQIDLGQASPPNATGLARFTANLSADAVDGEVYSTSVEVFDSLGVAHQLNLTFTYDQTNNEWAYNFDIPDGTPINVSPVQPDGVITFDGQGNLDTVDGTPLAGLTANRNIQFSFSNGAADLDFTWDLIDFSGTTPTGFVSNYGSNFSTGSLFQDGFGSGVLQDVTFDQNGTMIGFFDNGLTLELARISVATFNNAAGLRQVDGGYYQSTAASGPASIDGEGTGGRGSVLAGSLEASNVDIAEEFTALIVNQRGYQSNSRIITTVDQLLQEALNLKR